MKVIPSVIGCLGGARGIRRMKENIKELLSDEKELERKAREMQKKKNVWTVDMRYLPKLDD